MNENIHNEDAYFKRAYQKSEEDASPEVWDKVRAALDKEDAGNNHKKFIYWRIAVGILVLLLGSTAAYYTFSINGNTSDSVTTNKNKVNDSSIANANPLFNNKNNSTIKPANGITTNSFNYEKKTTIGSVPLPAHHANNDNRNHPWQALGHRKQNTEPVDYSSVKQAIRQSKPSSVLTTAAEKLLFQPVPATTMATLDNSNMQPADSSKNTTPANGFYDKVPENTIRENKATGVVILKQNAGSIQQNSALQKQVTNGEHTTSFIHRITLMPFFSADYTHNKLDNDAIANSNSQPEDKTAIQKREKQEFSYSAGITAKIPINRQWSIESGPIYSNIAIGIQPQILYASANGSQGVSYKFITSSGYAYVNPGSGIPPVAGDSIDVYISQHHLQYLNIPVLLSYNMFSKKHFAISVAEGISTNILLSTSVETELEDNNNKAFIAIHKLQGLRSLYFSYVADANLQLYFKKHISFTAIPSFRYAINPINKNNVVKTFPYSFGIGAGVTYRF